MTLEPVASPGSFCRGHTPSFQFSCCK